MRVYSVCVTEKERTVCGDCPLEEEEEEEEKNLILNLRLDNGWGYKGLTMAGEGDKNGNV